MIAIIQFGSVFIILIGLLTSATKLNNIQTVFSQYNNNTGFDSSVYVCSIGLLTGLFSFSGYEASAHMAEETHGCRTAAPLG